MAASGALALTLAVGMMAAPFSAGPPDMPHAGPRPFPGPDPGPHRELAWSAGLETFLPVAPTSPLDGRPRSEDEGSEKPDPPVTPEPALPVTLRMLLSQTTLPPGEELRVAAVAVNEGDVPVTYTHRGCPPDRIDLWANASAMGAGSGDRVPLYDYGSEVRLGTCALREVTLQPGERVVATAGWNGHLTSAPDHAPHEGPRAAPGNHTIVARLAVVGGEEGPVATAEVQVLPLRNEVEAAGPSRSEPGTADAHPQGASARQPWTSAPPAFPRAPWARS